MHRITSHSTRQHYTIYRIQINPAPPVTLHHGAQRSASSPLNMHLLAPTLAPTPTLGLLLTLVIRTPCSLHDGTRSILSSFFFILFYFVFFFDTIPHHAVPYHTIPLMAVHSYGPLLLYSSGLDWTRLSLSGLIWFGLFQVGIV